MGKDYIKFDIYSGMSLSVFLYHQQKDKEGLLIGFSEKIQ